MSWSAGSRRQSRRPTTTGNGFATRSGVYFDFVDGADEAFGLVFESDLRNQPPVQALVERMYTACVQAIAHAVMADAGLNGDSAWLVAVGVVGMSGHSARYWLTRRHELPKEDAVALTATLAWQASPASRCSSGPVHARRWGS
jgi:hypothetical protein